MKLKVALLADDVTQGQKKNILGIVRSINAIGYPVVHPQLSLYVEFLCEDGDEGSHDVWFDFVDGDYKSLVKTPKISFDVKESNSLVDLAMEVKGLHLPSEGTYGFKVFADGKEVITIPLQAQVIQQG